jgi:5-(carboxyamino)imidazole ribonucleotide mutase
MMDKKPKVLIVMGSDSDYPVLKECFSVLKDFNVDFEARVCSAHRTPEDAARLSRDAAGNGFEVIIAAAGKAAHLPGVLAAFTALPVIGIPVKASFDGLDALLSIVQMPPGIPVASMAVDGALNAGIFAVQILSVKYDYLKTALKEYKEKMIDKVREKDKKLQKTIAEDMK